MAHYCIFRTDRIGDLVLTLPMAEAIRRHDPSARITFCVQEYTAGLAALCPHIDDLLRVGDRDLPRHAEDFAAALRALRIDTAVFAYPRPRLAMAARRADIPVRVGTAYRWYAALFSHRVREHRKHATLHERDYNLNLLRALSISVPEGLRPALSIPDELRRRAEAVLGGAGIDPSARYVVVHPGSGGSAKDWPAASFARLGRELTRRAPELQLLITGTEAERALVDEVRDGTETGARTLAETVPLEVLAAILSRAALCVANSTGPLHIAAATGTPALGLYPFETVCHPRRWGPLGERALALTPERDTTCAACAAGSCARHDVMSRISVEQAADAALHLLHDV